MSEHDYQRGRRGGPADVSISDWERWKDWKAGHDEWEREQEDGDFERLLLIGDKNLINAEMRRREEERERKLAALDRRHKLHLESEQRRKRDASACWIATAYFGSPRHPSVVRLRSFRTHWLSQPLTRPVMVSLNRTYQIIGRTSFGRWWARGAGVGSRWCLRKWISRHILEFLLCHSAVDGHCLSTESNNRENALYYADALHIIGNAEQRHAPNRRYERFHVPPNIRAAGEGGREPQEETCRFIQLG